MRRLEDAGVHRVRHLVVERVTGERGVVHLDVHPVLVVEIADHYENLVARVEYNGNDYDELLNATMIESAPAAWDALRMRQVGDLTELRGRLDYLATAWNGYYRDLMDSYVEAMDMLIADLDRYLGSAR